jgi:fibronectin-binding autotransporter adhesin
VDGGATYTMTTDIANDNVYVGQNSTGTLIQGGFTNLVNSDIVLGLNADSRGTYNQSGGSLICEIGSLFIGNSGRGIFNQGGGFNTLSTLNMSYYAGSTGFYNLSGDSLDAFAEQIGNLGTAAFTQTGGANNMKYLTLGNSAGGSGVYTLEDGSLSVEWVETIGDHGTGTFNQSGGAHKAFLDIGETDVILGRAADGRGTYNLSCGSFIVDTLIIGGVGRGAFNQGGGNNTVRGFFGMLLGFEAGASGVYALEDGNLYVVGNETIGASGTGIFHQNGGNHSLENGSLAIGNLINSNGTYKLNGGSLNVPYEFIGYSGNGIFTQTGGAHRVVGPYAMDGALTLASRSGSRGTYNLEGGSLTARAIILNAGGLFNQTGGTVTLLSGGLSIQGGAFSVDNGGTLAVTCAGGGSGNSSPAPGATQATTTAGSITLSGTLALSLADGYNPKVGDRFTVLTFGSRRGDFAQVTGTNLGGGLYFKKVYTTTSLTLEVVRAANSAINLLLLN